jgi:hypothetical protein
MDRQFLILECMYFQSSIKEVFPATFHARNLRRLNLATAYLPIGSPLLTTAAGLVHLKLFDIQTDICLL